MIRLIGLSLVISVLLVSFLLLSGPSSELRLCETYSGLPNEFGNEVLAGMVYIPSGNNNLGNNRRVPMSTGQQWFAEEFGERDVHVNGFWMDKHEVTNAQFMAFVEATGFVTDAEETVISKAGEKVISASSAVFSMKDGVYRWHVAKDANWRQPFGVGSNTKLLENHPVVHVSHRDASAYAAWLGHSLPSEEQWEYAARSGKVRKYFPWGNSLKVNGSYMANTWQGQFPLENTVEDGYEYTSPVGCYPSSSFGLFDMVGNVWEITSEPTRHSDDKSSVVIKGGSHLCSENYCARFRPAARQPMEEFFGSSHLGFRTTNDAVEYIN